jgi:hypothetical protein
MFTLSSLYVVSSCREVTTPFVLAGSVSATRNSTTATSGAAADAATACAADND